MNTPKKIEYKVVLVEIYEDKFTLWYHENEW